MFNFVKSKKKKTRNLNSDNQQEKKNHILKHFSRVVTICKKIIPCYSWKSFHKDEQADGSNAADLTQNSTWILTSFVS